MCNTLLQRKEVTFLSFSVFFPWYMPLFFNANKYTLCVSLFIAKENCLILSNQKCSRTCVFSQETARVKQYVF